jgi:endonuclease/exonuclease/phosphatase family metal-dependent hydrolase
MPAKRLLSIILAFTIFQLHAQDLNVMTFNIRFNNPKDSANAWPNRKDYAASQVLFHHTHILGVQEALNDQIVDLQDRLKQYKYIGVGREDGKTKGEYSAIFYDTTRLRLLEGSTFWLSENPTVVGKAGWDAALPRIVTWARFRDKKTKKIFYHFNTHFDHMGQQARKESARLLLQKVKDIAGNTPVIVTGDFNATPTSEPVQVLLNPSDANRLTDTKAISKQPHYGPSGTFNAFGPKETSNEPIDWIFVKNGVTVLQHATLSQTWNGRFSSDHFPVYARLRIQ